MTIVWNNSRSNHGSIHSLAPNVFETPTAISIESAGTLTNPNI